MIVTVTLNPAIDKTVELDRFVHGGLNRIRRIIRDAGGKGINVSKTIRELGGTSVATGFVGGSGGKLIETMLSEMGIKTDFVAVSGETRVNTKVFEADGTLTELNEPGPVISEEEMEMLMDKLKGYASPDTLFVLSGSIPSLKEHPSYRFTYQKIIALAHQKGAKVLLDADGEVFQLAVSEGPDIIKPNIVELEAYLQEGSISEKEIWDQCDRFASSGIKWCIISQGSQGAMFQIGNYRAKCPALKVKIHSTVGAGDAMVASLAYAWEMKLEEKEIVRLCMAASAGAVMTEGTKPPSPELVRQLKTEVRIDEKQA